MICTINNQNSNTDKNLHVQTVNSIRQQQFGSN